MFLIVISDFPQSTASAIYSQNIICCHVSRWKMRETIVGQQLLPRILLISSSSNHPIIPSSSHYHPIIIPLFRPLRSARTVYERLENVPSIVADHLLATFAEPAASRPSGGDDAAESEVCACDRDGQRDRLRSIRARAKAAPMSNNYSHPTALHKKTSLERCAVF